MANYVKISTIGASALQVDVAQGRQEAVDRVIEYWRQVDGDLGARVATGLG